MADFALPNNQVTPTKGNQFAVVVLVSSDIRHDFFFPEFLVCHGPPKVPAVMSMPEASVNEDHFPSARKHNIGPSWKVFSVKPVSVSIRP